MGKKNTTKQKLVDISNKTKEQAKLAWQNEMLNSDIMKKFDLSYAHFYNLVGQWKHESPVKIQGGSTIMSHPQYNPQNIVQDYTSLPAQTKDGKENFKITHPTDCIQLAHIEDPNIFINQLKHTQKISQAKVDNFNKKKL